MLDIYLQLLSLSLHYSVWCGFRVLVCLFTVTVTVIATADQLKIHFFSLDRRRVLFARQGARLG